MWAADVSRETSERLEIYLELLRRWNPKINLVAPATLKHAAHRHFDDSLQLLKHAPDTARSWVDLGSGGGFPGLVVAIQAAETRPDLSVSLVESDQRKSVFLRTVLRETGVTATVHAKRIEAMDPGPVDVVSARALAALPQLLQLSDRFIGSGTLCLFPKGRSHQEELAAAREDWHFQAEAVPSQTDPDSALLILKDIRHA